MPLIILSNNAPTPEATQQPPVKKTVSEVVNENNEHILVVNGKQKKIGQKSKYLLDMLTLDEE